MSEVAIVKKEYEKESSENCCVFLFAKEKIMSSYPHSQIQRLEMFREYILKTLKEMPRTERLKEVLSNYVQQCARVPDNVKQPWSIDMYGPVACQVHQVQQVQLIRRLLAFHHSKPFSANLSAMHALDQYEQIHSDTYGLHYKLPQGTLLYRVPDSLAMTGLEYGHSEIDSNTAAPSFKGPDVSSLDPDTCMDTEKKGLYFATSKYIPLGMLVEMYYQKERQEEKKEEMHQLGTFELTQDIALVYGKYTADPPGQSHIECNAVPLEVRKHNTVFSLLSEHVNWGCEVFLNPNDLKHIRYKEHEMYKVQEADDILKAYAKEHYSAGLRQDSPNSLQPEDDARVGISSQEKRNFLQSLKQEHELPWEI